MNRDGVEEGEKTKPKIKKKEKGKEKMKMKMKKEDPGGTEELKEREFSKR